MTARKGFTTEEAAQVARQLGHILHNSQELENLRMGMDVELEHGIAAGANNVTNDDPIQTAKIALAHLAEFEDYYQRLDDMERQARNDAQGLARFRTIAAIIIALMILVLLIVVLIFASKSQGRASESVSRVHSRDMYM